MPMSNNKMRTKEMFTLVFSACILFFLLECQGPGSAEGGGPGSAEGGGEATQAVKIAPHIN
jgi:hypothetical protein